MRTDGHSCGQGPQALALGTGGTEHYVRRGLGFPLGITGRGGLGGGAARPACRTRLRHALVEPWKNPGAHGRGGPARKDGGNKGGPAAGCSHGKTQRGAGAGAAAKRRRAPRSPDAFAGRSGRGCSQPPPRGTPWRRSGGGIGEKWGGPGKQKMLDREGRPVPGARQPAAPTVSPHGRGAFEAREGWPGLVLARHTQRCTRPLGRRGSRGRLARRGGHTDPRIGPDACSEAHTRGHLHARAHRHASCPYLPGPRERKGPTERGRNVR